MTTKKSKKATKKTATKQKKAKKEMQQAQNMYELTLPSPTKKSKKATKKLTVKKVAGAPNKDADLESEFDALRAELEKLLPIESMVTKQKKVKKATKKLAVKKVAKKTAVKNSILDMNGEKLFEGDFVITDDGSATNREAIENWENYDYWALNHRSVFEIQQVIKVHPSGTSVYLHVNKKYITAKKCLKVEMTDSQKDALINTQFRQFF